MFPTLLNIGSFHLRTLSVFQAIAFFACALVFWKRAREESYSEVKVFDGFLISFIIGWLSGRVGHIVINYDQFGFDVLKWLNVVHYPGQLLSFFLLGATLYLYFYAKKEKWDAFEILDWWAQALTMGLIWLNLGFFFTGILFGKTTNLPWGVVFPGVFEPRHPVQIYYVIFLVILYKFLNWLEFNYRTFSWYRAGKKTAQTGFLFIVFLFSYGLFSLLMKFFQPALIVVGEFSFDTLFYLGLIFFALYLLLLRSNRSFFSVNKKKFFAIKR